MDTTEEFDEYERPELELATEWAYDRTMSLLNKTILYIELLTVRMQELTSFLENKNIKKMKFRYQVIEFAENKQKLSELENELKNLPDINNLKKLRENLNSNFEVTIRSKLIEAFQKIDDDEVVVGTVYINYHNFQVAENKRKKEEAKELEKAKEKLAKKETPLVVEPIVVKEEVKEEIKEEILEEETIVFEKEEKTKVYSSIAINLFQQIIYGQDLEVIVKLLPDYSDTNYEQLKQELLGLLEEEYDKLISYANALDGEESEEVYQMAYYIDYLASHLENYFGKIDNNIVTETKVDAIPRNLLFAKNGNGEPLIYSDIEDVPQEYRYRVRNLMIKLKSGLEFSGESEIRILTNNKKMDKIVEIKLFNVRITYRVLGNNNFLITNIILKKDQNSKKYQQEIISRNKTCESQYQTYLKLSKEGNITEDMLTEENGYYDYFMNEVLQYPVKKEDDFKK
ncbi:MAG: hypothetical protein R3Y21_02465 [Mycoplasmatota bacterium]